MEFQQFGNQYVLRLLPGEEVMNTLLAFIMRQDIRGGYFMAFGGFSRVHLRYFDVAERQYRDHAVDGQVEVVSLLGNVSRVDGEPQIHMHAAVSDVSGRTNSGHIAEGLVRPTLEVFLTKLDGELRRARDPVSGLELLALGEPVETANGDRRR
jgi:predicted DNA-binding protein with PD1-like motif